MDFGVHLPLIAFEDTSWSLDGLRTYAEETRRLGYAALSANDHLVFRRPWLDGPTALAAVLDCTGEMALATTVAIPVVRGPVAVAKSLGAIDVLSGARLIVGVGPGSSRADYSAAGVPFDERWQRLDEAVQALRALWRKHSPPFRGRFYSTEGMTLEPRPATDAGPPIWIGSWGSDAGLRRTARLADGWLASAYNTTPEAFGAAWQKLRNLLRDAGKDPEAFPNAIATMTFHVTEDEAEAQRVLSELIGPALGRTAEELGERLLVGPAEVCAEKLRAYQDAGAQRVYLWPVRDELRQLELFKSKVAPLV